MPDSGYSSVSAWGKYPRGGLWYFLIRGLWLLTDRWDLLCRHSFFWNDIINEKTIPSFFVARGGGYTVFQKRQYPSIYINENMFVHSFFRVHRKRSDYWSVWMIPVAIRSLLSLFPGSIVFCSCSSVPDEVFYYGHWRSHKMICVSQLTGHNLGCATRLVPGEVFVAGRSLCFSLLVVSVNVWGFRGFLLCGLLVVMVWGYS